MIYDWTNLDHWEQAFIKDNPYKNAICWTDEGAFENYKHSLTSLIYNKYNLIKLLTYQTVWDLSHESPTYYPIIVKPKTNLLGMGVGAYKANSKKDIKSTKEMIAQPFYEGEHLSTDFIIWNSRVSDYTTFLGHKDNKGSFTLFESVDQISDSALDLVNRLAPVLRFGIVNVETIDGYVLEAHLRPSTQFYDIDGGLVSRYLKKLAESPSEPLWGKRHKFIKSYSKVYRRSTDGKPKLGKLPELPKGVSSIQLCWEDGCKLSDEAQDEHSYRVMVGNGTDQKTLDNYCDLVYTSIIYEDL